MGLIIKDTGKKVLNMDMERKIIPPGSIVDTNIQGSGNLVNGMDKENYKIMMGLNRKVIKLLTLIDYANNISMYLLQINYCFLIY